MALQFEHPPMKEDTARDPTMVRFTGRKVLLDEESLHHIHEQLLALADEPSKSELLLDFSNVEYVSAKLLGTLVSLHKKLLARDRHMIVGNLSPQLYEVFAVTRLDKFFDLRLAEQEGEPGTGRGQSFHPPAFLS
jgi:anti-sigma B factor antagonist